MLKYFNKNKNSNEVNTAFVNGLTEVQVKTKQTLLAAALDAGITWPHSCQVGSCKQCKCKIIQGNTRSLVDLDYVLSRSEQKNGYMLACQTVLNSDVTVEIDLLTKDSQKPLSPTFENDTHQSEDIYCD